MSDLVYTTHRARIGPKWWQLRWRFVLWRVRVRDRRWRKENPELARAADEIENAMTHHLLFGAAPKGAPR